MQNPLKFPNIDEEDKRKRIILSIFLLIATPTLLAFALWHFSKSNYSTFYVDVLVSFVFYICLVRLQNIPNSKPIARIASTIFMALLLYLLMSESKDGSTILWMYTVPIVVCLFFGKKEGLFWTTIFFCLAMGVVLFSPLPHAFHYGVGTKIRFPVSFILVAIFSYYIEATRLRAHIALVKEKKKTQRYLDIAGVMLTVLDSKGEITLINQKGCKILEIDEGEAIGKSWFDHFVSQDIVEEIKEVFGKLMAREIDTVEYYESPIITKAGNERIIAFHSTILTDEEGIVNGILVSGDDITDRKLLEAEREKLIIKLTNAVKEIKTLQGIIPICSFCKNIRDEKGLWNRLEAYIHNHSDAQFSHSVCPKCAKEHYPEFVDKNGNI
jgi:PAS domain S-box-containing protein